MLFYIKFNEVKVTNELYRGWQNNVICRFSGGQGGMNDKKAWVN